jgi:deazaflavin-dependent oxidoreductase (nitroreductase family)
VTKTTVSLGVRTSSIAVAVLLRSGVRLGPLRILETTGRSSGETRSTSIAVIVHDGQRWLVSPFGDTNWVRNIRAHPTATLVSGRRRETVTLDEADHETAAPVLKRYLQTYQRVPFVPPAFRAHPDSPVGVFLQEASRHPVFAVVAMA